MQNYYRQNEYAISNLGAYAPVQEKTMSFLEEVEFKKQKKLLEEKQREEQKIKAENEQRNTLAATKRLNASAKQEPFLDSKIQKSLDALENFQKKKDLLPTSDKAKVAEEMEEIDTAALKALNEIGDQTWVAPTELQAYFNEKLFRHVDDPYKIIKDFMGFDLRTLKTLNLYPEAQRFYRLHISLYPSLPVASAANTRAPIVSAYQPITGMTAYQFPVISSNLTVPDLTMVRPLSNAEVVQMEMPKFARTLATYYYSEYKANGLGEKLKDALVFLEECYSKNYFDAKTTWEQDSLLPFVFSKIAAGWNEQTIQLLDICKNSNLRDQVLNYFSESNRVPEKSLVDFLQWYFTSATVVAEDKVAPLIKRLAEGHIKGTIKVPLSDMGIRILKRLEPVFAQKCLDPFDCDKALEFLGNFYKAPHRYFDRKIPWASVSAQLVDKIAEHLLKEDEKSTEKRIAKFISWYVEHTTQAQSVWTANAQKLFENFVSNIISKKYNCSYHSKAVFNLIEDHLARNLCYALPFDIQKSVIFLFKHLTHSLYTEPNGTGHITLLQNYVVRRLLEKNNNDVVKSLEALVNLYPNKKLPGCLRLHHIFIGKFKELKQKLPSIPIQLLWPNLPKESDSLIEASQDQKEITYKGVTYKFIKQIARGVHGSVAQFSTDDGKENICVKKYFHVAGPDEAWTVAQGVEILKLQKNKVAAFGANPSNPNEFIMLMDYIKGETLADVYKRIRKGTKKDHELLELFLLPLRALREFHHLIPNTMTTKEFKEYRFVHGDPKADNVMLIVDPITGKTQAKLFDLECSRELSDSTFQFDGNPTTYWMAPELGKGIGADFSQDITRTRSFLYPNGFINSGLTSLISQYNTAVTRINPKQRPSLDLIISTFEEAAFLLKTNDRQVNWKLMKLAALIHPTHDIQTKYLLELLKQVPDSFAIHPDDSKLVEEMVNRIDSNLSANFLTLKNHNTISSMDKAFAEQFDGFLKKFANYNFANYKALLSRSASRLEAIKLKSELGRDAEADFDREIADYYSSPFVVPPLESSSTDAKETSNNDLITRMTNLCRQKMTAANEKADEKSKDSTKVKIRVKSTRDTLFQLKAALHLLNLLHEPINIISTVKSELETGKSELETIAAQIYKFISRVNTMSGATQDLKELVGKNVLLNRTSPIKTPPSIDAKGVASQAMFDELKATAAVKDYSIFSKNIQANSQQFFFEEFVKNNLFDILLPQAKSYLFNQLASFIVKEKFNLHFALTFLSYYLNNVAQKIESAEIKALVQKVGDTIFNSVDAENKPLNKAGIKALYPNTLVYTNLHTKLIRAYYNHDRHGFAEYPRLFNNPKQALGNNKLVVAPLVPGRAATI